VARCSVHSNARICLLHSITRKQKNNKKSQSQSDFRRAAKPQTPRGLQWGDPHSPSKLPPPTDRSTNLTRCLIPGPIRPTIATASISDQPFCHNALNRHTETNRWLEGMFRDYRPLSLHGERRRGLTIRREMSPTTVQYCTKFICRRQRRTLRESRLQSRVRSLARCTRVKIPSIELSPTERPTAVHAGIWERRSASTIWGH